MWMKDGVPWMIDRVIAFYTVCLLICRERGPMGLLLSSLHSRIFTYGGREFVFAFSVSLSLLHVLERLDLLPRIECLPRSSASTGQS